MEFKTKKKLPPQKLNFFLLKRPSSSTHFQVWHTQPDRPPDVTWVLVVVCSSLAYCHEIHNQDYKHSVAFITTWVFRLAAQESQSKGVKNSIQREEDVWDGTRI